MVRSRDTPTPPDASPAGITSIADRRASRPDGRPCADRQWVECYAQLVGTALSLWDAAALDAAGEEGDVPPTFINLADASIKMIETLPTRNRATPSLKNVLSICSANQNRYLLHFNSFHSLTQWTAAIRLALFEHTSLYEAYTGSIIAGKGKSLNNIRGILERNRFKHEDWARVRFGAGTPWRRCWFVITPPNEKELQKAQKSIKKKSAYDRTPRLVTGDIKFYETKKTKKAKPIATITDAYSAYAIYPQSKPLIDQSTLVKIEGKVTIHSQPEATSEGFVFVMPEVHPAVPGFEMMIRFLIPTFDTFNLYGRPTRLIAAVNNIKSIMFAFPDERRYGYLDILDIASLMQTPGSQNWSEAEWRQQLKEATLRRMAAGGSRTSSMSGGKPRFRSSLPSRYSNVPTGPVQRNNATFPARQPGFNQSTDAIVREETPDESFSAVHHTRGVSDTTGLSPLSKHQPGSFAESSPSSSAQDLAHHGRERPGTNDYYDQSSSEGDSRQRSDPQAEAIGQQLRPPSPPSPVVIPPAFTHGPGEMPSTRPQPSPDLRKANNRMSHGTLSQLVAASGNKNLLGIDSRAEGHEAEEHFHEQNQESAPETSYLSDTDRFDLPPIYFDSDDKRPVPEQQAPPAAEHRSSTFGVPPALSSGQNIQLQANKSLKRKPLPQENKELGIPSPVGEPSFDDLRHTVDEDAFNRVGPHHPSLPSPIKEGHQDEESVYDDASTVSPDYASTHGSIYSKRSIKSIPKPRMGVKKTVGTAPSKDLVIGDAHYSLDKPSQANPDIPSIDFGPTLTYLPTTGRPHTSDALKSFGHQKTDSDVTERQRISVPTQQMDRAHSRPPSQDEFRRSVLWQPGMAGARPTTPGASLSPEQFVQQRAAPSPPVQMHHRTSSASPPPARPVSGDWMAHTRSQSQMNLSRDGPPRPNSRGASSMMNYNDISSHLSAREQEHVARMTGSSFFNISSEKKQETKVNPMGLVGAIDAREREKKGIMEGMSNQMVQHAIAQRQHHFQQQQMSSSPPTQSYGVQGGRHSVYNLPTASHTWDALNQSYRPEEPRRQSWYGQFASQQPQTYQQNQLLGQHSGYVGTSNAMHY
ncbi:hypothetical protein EYZ11_006599 [Aspergillus tanneri]|uniref:PH domain-containing protein n=1 Tax=Aspergillus tanneri TaxID=1220188 RepID=A0A4S3JHB5_9EURO|nr:hypothetical protein EYZ11_006599 [Aspergillus tanneri]